MLESLQLTEALHLDALHAEREWRHLDFQRSLYCGLARDTGWTWECQRFGRDPCSIDLFEKRTAPSATPKRLLGISCIKNRLSQTTEATLGDGGNAGQWARAGKKPRYPVSLRSLRSHVIDVAVASRRIQDVPMNRCALCAPPLEIFGNVYLP